MKRTDTEQRNAVVGALYENNAGYLYETAFYMLKSHSDAQDAVEETFGKLLGRSSLPEFSDERAAKAFLITSVKNTCIDMLRKKKHRDKLRTDLYGNMAAECEDIRSPAEAECMLDCLPEKLRIVMTLRYIEDHDSSEIAAMLGIKRSTVQARIRRSKHMILSSLSL